MSSFWDPDLPHTLESCWSTSMQRLSLAQFAEHLCKGSRIFYVLIVDLLSKP